MKFKDLVKQLESKGWMHIRTRGSHCIFTHVDGKRPIPVPKHSNEVPEKLARTILKQAERNIKKKG